MVPISVNSSWFIPDILRVVKYFLDAFKLPISIPHLPLSVDFQQLC